MATASSNVQFRHPRIALKIWTEHNEIKINYNDTISPDKYTTQEQMDMFDDSLTATIMSFQTSNSMEDDSSAFSLILAGDYKWDYVIYPWDIINIAIYPNQVGVTYPSGYNYNVMTGIVTEIHRIGSYDSDSYMFQINGKSMEQVFDQYQLGLVEQVESSISSMGWLWDTNMDLKAESTETSSSDSSSSSSGVPSTEKAFLKLPLDNDFGASTAKMDACAKSYSYRVKEFNMTTSEIEKASSIMKSYGMDPAIGWAYERNEGGPYSWFNHYGSLSGGWESQLKTTLKTIVSTAKGAGANPAARKYPKGSIGRMYASETEAAREEIAGNPGSYGTPVKNMMKFIKEMGGTGSSSSSSDDSSSTSTTSTSGNTNTTDSAIENEMENSQGVAFLGNDVATIEKELVDRFLPYMKYSYGVKDYGLDHFLKYDDMTSWTEWEKLQDSSDFVNWSGSLWDLMQEAQRTPFTEMFFDTDYSGKSHLIVRRTPFDKDDWDGTIKVNNKTTYVIPRYDIKSTMVLEDDIAKEVDQIYSVFNVNPATADYTGIKNASSLGSLPQFNQQLIDTNGYSTLETTDLYLAGSGGDPYGSSSDKGTTAKKAANVGTYWDATKVNDLLSKVKTKVLYQKGSTYAQEIADSANNISGEEAASIVEAYRDSGNTGITQDEMDGILNTANGGGISATGTTKINYKQWLAIAKKYPNDNIDYFKECKATFSNADDELLLQLKTQFSNGGGSLSQKEYNKVVKSAGGSSTSVRVGKDAEDLKLFTTKLYNWYCEDYNFYSGDITIVGDPKYRIGAILNYYDAHYGTTMEFYIESVEHIFSWTDGYQTILGVTRGLDNSGKDRFTNMWGKNQDFLGGYMGEAALDELSYAVNPTSSSSSSSDDSDDSGTLSGAKANKVSAAAAEFAYGFRKPHYTARKEIYALGDIYKGANERGSTNPLTSGSGPIILDCSSFVHWCFHKVGASVPSQTKKFCASSKFKKVSSPKIGDIFFCNSRAHMGFYVGSGKTICWNIGAGTTYGIGTGSGAGAHVYKPSLQGNGPYEYFRYEG